MTEPRTIREARLRLRELEAELDRLRMSPAVALTWGPAWYLRKAQTSLRQAERYWAKADDPRLEALPPLPPSLARLSTTRPKRRRYRCAVCMAETLMTRDDVERAPMHRTAIGGGNHRVIGYAECGEWQPVPRLPKGLA